MADAIARIGAEQRRTGEAGQGPATAPQIEAARKALRDRLAAVLPAGYAAFLSRCNGLDHDGLVLYGASQTPAAPGPAGFWQGLAAANGLWREGPGHDGYLVLGETDMDLLTVSLDGADPVLRDKLSGDVGERFGDVGEAVETLAARRLGGGSA